ncbi:MAG TPA: hypothetical protein PLP29_14485 [Candidatus Ozemobacteraceae bacterium]|nr:hypothetical protein [Candidatus Ozemobacteraceae bacterium]
MKPLLMLISFFVLCGLFLLCSHYESQRNLAGFKEFHRTLNKNFSIDEFSSVAKNFKHRITLEKPNGERVDDASSSNLKELVMQKDHGVVVYFYAVEFNYFKFNQTCYSFEVRLQPPGVVDHIDPIREITMDISGAPLHP